MCACSYRFHCVIVRALCPAPLAPIVRLMLPTVYSAQPAQPAPPLTLILYHVQPAPTP